MSLRNEDSFPIDLPPEYCQYQDEGCEFSSQCLNCRLPVCVYEQPGGKQRFMKRRRALEMARLYRNEHKTVRELASMFGVSMRTVQRALKTVLGERKEREH